MENPKASSKIHPLVAGAAVSVMLVSLVGVAAITGLLPSSNSTTAPVAILAPSTPIPAADKVSTLAPTTQAKQFAATEETDSAAAAQSRPRHRPVHPSTYKPAPDYSENGYAPPVQAAICDNCGTIEAVRAIQQAAPPNGIGAVAGAVLGGILGNQVGGGSGRKLATVAGAVGGGFAGNEVERRTRTTTSYEIRVRMEDGSMRSFTDSGQSGWRSGDRVRVVNGHLVSQG